MEILKNIGVLILIVIVYFLLQILGSFIEFGLFGAGNGIKGYELYVPIGMLIVNLILIVFLKHKTSLFKSKIVSVFSIFLSIGLFLYSYC